MQERFIEVEVELAGLLNELIVPLRSKIINEQAFEKLFCILEKLSYLLKDEVSVSKKISGQLFFIYTQIETQAKFSKYPEPLFEKKALLLNSLRKIFVFDLK